MTQAQLATSLGHQYIDFEAQILDKKYGFDDKVSLSQYVQGHKVVLLDFWASWCTPCINEIPNIKAAYKKFKSKGFEVVSVSVDDDTDAWIKAVKDNGMNWIQLWNGEEMQNSAAVKYSISAIPSTFLIDADGTIIGRNLRDKELEEALEDYFSRN
jgi:thiol-disulfide isomerase/thioredoxin